MTDQANKDFYKAAEAIQDGSATTEDLKFWINHPYRCSGGELGDTALQLLLERIEKADEDKRGLLADKASVVSGAECAIGMLDDQLNQVAAQYQRLCAAVEPFVTAFEEVRQLHQSNEDHDDPERMQELLDVNEVTPGGTVTGHWRILANIYKESPAASIAEVQAQPLELLKKNLLSDMPSAVTLERVIRYVDCQLGTIRQQAQEAKS